MQLTAEGAGTIAEKELGTVMRSLGHNPTEGELAEILKSTNAESGVSFPEFLSIMASRMSCKETKEDIIEAFRVFDKEGNGCIFVAELRHVLTTLGEKMTNEEVDELICEAQVDERGAIQYRELVEKITPK